MGPLDKFSTGLDSSKPLVLCSLLINGSRYLSITRFFLSSGLKTNSDCGFKRVFPHGFHVTGGQRSSEVVIVKKADMWP